MKRDYTYWLYIAILIFLIASYAKVTFNGIKAMLDREKDTLEEVVEVEQIDTTDFLMEMGEKDVDVDTVNEVLSFLGVEHPRVVYAQMRLESGNFNSSLTLTNNNYFGMRHPSRRETHSLGKVNGYASYSNWAFSVADYALWQRKYARGLTEDEYILKLGKMYATDRKYTEKINKIMKEI